MDDKRVFSTEVAPVALNDSSQDSESHKIYKCHSKKRDDTQNEGSSQDVIDCNNIPVIYIETSDEDDTSEGLSGDVEQTETQLPLATNLGSSVDCGGEFAYYISAVNYNLEILKEKYFKDRIHSLSLNENYDGSSAYKEYFKRQKEYSKGNFCELHNIKR